MKNVLTYCRNHHSRAPFRITKFVLEADTKAVLCPWRQPFYRETLAVSPAKNRIIFSFLLHILQ